MKTEVVREGEVLKVKLVQDAAGVDTDKDGKMAASLAGELVLTIDGAEALNELLQSPALQGKAQDILKKLGILK